jgi:hypothetical protein
MRPLQFLVCEVKATTYMNPLIVDLEIPYCPAFDMPDYKVLLGSLRKQMYSGYPFGGPDDLPWYADPAAEMPVFESIEWNKIDLASSNCMYNVPHFYV